MKYLPTINSPADLKKIPIGELPIVAEELRQYLIDTLSNVGGHLASNLGVVELTIALHYVFDSPTDKLIWDVGHQTYPHKILTGRKEALKQVRKKNGISGFPKREESPHDTYNTGHAGTSISQMLGEAVARDVKNEKYHSIAIVGDASISSGMSFEAMNHGGYMKRSSMIILNDNDMAISNNVGALNQYLAKLIARKSYNIFKKFLYNSLNWIPVIGLLWVRFLRKTESGLKHLLLPGSFFEQLGFRYFGPIDGHNIAGLIEILENLKKRKEAIVLHIVTQKGKGYKPAEADPIKFHGVSPFNKKDGSFTSYKKNESMISYSEIAGEVVSQIAKDDYTVQVVTPAMIEGSGLNRFYRRFPQQLHDVGIAEQHAGAFSGAMASSGMKAFFFIYSTFLQRAFDQLVHDIALMNLPVKILIDRAGVVGADGETHQGLYDLALLLSSPNVKIHCPRNGEKLVQGINTAYHDDSSPIAIRYPREQVSIKDLPTFTNEKISYSKNDFGLNFKLERLQIGKAELISQGEKVVLLAIGFMVSIAKKVSEIVLRKTGINITVIDLVWIRPLDLACIQKHIAQSDFFYILEDASSAGGAVSHILQELSLEYRAKFIQAFNFPDVVVEHGTRQEQFLEYSLDAESIAKIILENNF